MEPNQPVVEPLRGQAILFTHVGLKADRAQRLEDVNERDAFAEEHVSLFRECMRCRNVAIVYIYVDVAIRELRLRGNTFSISATAEELEGLVVNCLESARTTALAILPAPHTQLPKFIFIGVQELVHLFRTLTQIDPLLLRRIAGTHGHFTYDSPKFVEAVIRIVRGVEPYLCQNPIIRIDEDVLPNEEGLDLLLAKTHEHWRRMRKYFFFSGAYCGPIDPDSWHEHAVRTHWLERNGPGACAFLGDLAEVGATQIVPSTPGGPALPGHCSTTARGDVPRSAAGDRLADERKRNNIPYRASPQAISGAGLVMSTACIMELPPFVIPNLVVWVDDHLKRRLHEQVGHIPHAQIERILQARFVQERQGDRAFAKTSYFERLFRGCLMHRLIVDGRDGAGPLAHYAELAVKGRLKRASQSAAEKLRGAGHTKDKLVNEFLAALTDHGSTVLEMWRESSQAYGDTLLAEWADEVSSGRSSKSSAEISASVANDAFDYLVMITEWSDYVRAILRLRFKMASWLFATAED